MKFTSWLLFAWSSIYLASCEKLHNEEKVEVIRIEGFRLTDNLGNTMGIIGEASDDWNFVEWKTLSALEKSFLEFADQINMINTRVCNVNVPVSFPNPFIQKSQIFLHTDDSVKLKLAIVDASGYVWRNMAVKMKGNKLIYFDFSNGKQFPSGMSLRYYYSFSAASKPHFKVGYGDIKICNNSSDYLSCF